MNGSYGKFYPNWRNQGIVQVRGRQSHSKKEQTWLGYHKNQNGVKPIKDKTEGITKLEASKNVKELKSILISIQHLSKFVNNLSKKTGRMKRLLEKEAKWEWTRETNEDFENLKKEITEAPCLENFDPKKDNYVATDARNTRLGATLWQKEGEVFRLVAFASRFLRLWKKYAINQLELLGALWGLEHSRYNVYEKRVNLLTDHQALRLLPKRNRAHKQYSARLTRCLDLLSHFDVNLQYTAGINIPLTDYIGRHSIIYTGESEAENETKRREETESEEEIVINQICGSFGFNRTIGSITQFVERTAPSKGTDQSQRGIHTRERNQNGRSIETSPISISPINPATHTKKVKMDKLNGIDMEFIFKKRPLPRNPQATYGTDQNPEA